MAKKIDIRSFLLALTLAVCTGCLLYFTLAKPVNTHTYNFSVESSKAAELHLILTDVEALEYPLNFDLKAGQSKLVSFQSAQPGSVKMVVKYTETPGDLQLNGFQYARSFLPISAREFEKIPGFRLVEGSKINSNTLQPQGQQIVAEIDLSSFAISSKKHAFLQFVFVLIISVLALLLFYVALLRIRNTSTKNALAALFVALVFAFGFYHVLESLAHHRSRAELAFDWITEPNCIYGFMFSKTNSFADGVNVYYNPTDPASVPIKFTSERDPIESVRLDFECDQPIELNGLVLKNALSYIRLQPEEIQEAFCLSNDLRVELVNNDQTLKWVPTGPDPYVVFNNEMVPVFKLIDRLVFRAHLYVAYVVWIVLFFGFLFFSTKKRYVVIRDGWFVMAFCLVISVPGILWWFSTPITYFPEEKRLAVNLKNLDTLAVGQATQRIDNYFSDHFGARADLISTDNLLNVLLFNQANDLSTVLIGKEGWMFYRGELVGEVYINEYPYDTATLETIRRNLLEREHWLHQHGSKFYVTFPPLKHAVYPEMLPYQLKAKNEMTKTDQVIAYLKETTSLNVIELKEEMKNHKILGDLYYRKDTHWNHMGAFVAYKQIARRWAEDFEGFEDIYGLEDMAIGEHADHAGDLPRLLGLSDYYERKGPVVIPNFPTHYEKVEIEEEINQFFSEYGIKYVNKTVKPELTLLVFRDSFTNFWFQHLNNHFSEVKYIWTHQFRTDVFEQGYPDVVLLEMLERFSYDLTYPNPPEVQAFYQAHLDTIEADIPVKPLPAE